MSNAERVRRAFEAFTRGDMEPLGELIDPSFEVDDRVTPEANPTTRGLDALIENAAHVFTMNGEGRATKLVIYRTWEEASRAGGGPG